MTPAPAPSPTSWPDPRWVQAQRRMEWVRGFVFPAGTLTTDFTGAVEAIGIKKAAQMMREEGN